MRWYVATVWVMGLAPIILLAIVNAACCAYGVLLTVMWFFAYLIVTAVPMAWLASRKPSTTSAQVAVIVGAPLIVLTVLALLFYALVLIIGSSF